MIKTKYGKVTDESLDSYLKGLIPRIFKILPLKEEEYETLDIYIDSLLREMIGLANVVDELKLNTNYLSIIGTLENLLDENDIKIFKRDVFKCLDIIKKMRNTNGDN